MAILTSNIDDLLNPNYVEIEILNELSPALSWLDLFPPTQNDVGQFKRMNAAESAKARAEGGGLGQPLELGPLSELDTINISKIDYNIGKLAVFGYSIEFLDTAKKQGDFADDLKRGYNQAIYNMADKACSIVGAEFMANARKSKADIKGNWSAEDAVPDSDMTLLEKEMMIEGKPWRLDTMLLNKNPFFGYKDYVKTIPGLDAKVGLDEIERNGAKYRNFNGALPEGTGAGMDSRFPPISTFKNVDPAYSNVRRVEIDAATNKDSPSNKETESFPQSLINIDMFKEQRTPKYNVIELWMEFGAGMKEPEASMLVPGL